MILFKKCHLCKCHINVNINRYVNKNVFCIIKYNDDNVIICNSCYIFYYKFEWNNSIFYKFMREIILTDSEPDNNNNNYGKALHSKSLDSIDSLDYEDVYNEPQDFEYTNHNLESREMCKRDLFCKAILKKGKKKNTICENIIYKNSVCRHHYIYKSNILSLTI